MAVDFVDIPLGGSVELHIHVTDKFKANLVSIYMHQQLSDQYVTQHALLPEVLMRGCQRYPDQAAIQRRLQELYGADLSTSVNQWGDIHSIAFHLELVEDRFIPQGEGLLSGGIDLLHEILSRPVTEGNGLKPDYLEQEKNNLRNHIEGLVNDKARYATKRCLEEMFEGLPYALYSYGRVQDLPSISAQSLYAYYREAIDSLPMDIFVVGSRPVDEVAEMVRRLVERPDNNQNRPVPSRIVLPRRGPQQIIEQQEVQQGKLCLSYRTNVFSGDPGYNAMTVYNGILGGFVHSKLFRNVREKASLAYYANSRVDGLRGAMLVTSGIDVANYDQAVEIINRQIEDMRRGDFDDMDLLFTQRALANIYRTLGDSPASLVDRAMYGLISGRSFDLDERLREIESVRRDEVVEVAQNVELDTIYFLTNDAKA